MQITIIGTGGVGGYFGGRLAQAGNNVTFIARGEHLKAIQEKGLVVRSIKGDFTVTNTEATDSIALAKPADLVLICVKAWQVKDVAKQLASTLKPDTIVLPLQNGVLAADELAEFIPKQHIVKGLCRIFSLIEAPGIINHVAVEPTIIFGEVDNTSTPRILQLSNAFTYAGITSKVAKDIDADLWKKFISICVSAQLALTRSTYGELRELPLARNMMISLIEEIYRLSQKIGINIEPDFPQKAMAFIDTFPHSTTSSLTRDVWEGKPSEIEYQNGTVVKLAEKFGIETPINRFLYECILPMELKARKQ